jgi:cytochrome c oxidase subunit 1
MFLSLVMFGFIGGISGVVLGTEQINLLMHNTLYVPGHFHGTVVTGTTLAFMAATYLVLPLVFQREIVFPRLAKIQPYLFGIGAAGISLFMMGAGTLGVPRRHWDITLADAQIPYEFSAGAFLMMGLNGLSAILASLGGIIYVVVVVASVLWGKKVDASKPAWQFPVIGGAAANVARYGSHTTVKLPGTIILVGVFFVAFMLYYYVNWKYLSAVWPLR